MNIMKLDEYRYKKYYAKASGMVDMSQDVQYITKLNNHNNLRKEYTKSWIKLLSERGI